MATRNSTRPGPRARATESRLTRQRTHAAHHSPREFERTAYETARSHHDALNELQQQVLDALAVCTVVADALDPSNDEMIRLLALAEKRLKDVSDAMGRIANEFVGVAHG